MPDPKPPGRVNWKGTLDRVFFASLGSFVVMAEGRFTVAALVLAFALYAWRLDP